MIFLTVGGRGGGVFAGNDEDGNSGRITIASSMITGNTAANGSLYSSFGGGIYNSYAPTNNYLTLNRSLISGNSATNGSEIANFQPITAQVYVPPVYYPNDTEPPYDILTPGGYITVNVISADNFNLFGSNNDPGIYNDPLITPPLAPGLSDTVPPAGVLLGPLKANGGLTKTHALLKGSPAMKKVLSGCPATDQRGTKRPQPRSTPCDIGSFEAK